MTCRVTPSGSSSPVARKRRRRSGATTNCIAEWKHDLGAAGFCLKEFFATEAAFRAISLLFNLLAEFQRAAGLPGHDPHSGADMRRDSRAGRAPAGGPFVAKLGRSEHADPLAGQHSELAASNCAELGSGVRDLGAAASPNAFKTGQKGDRIGFQLRNSGLGSVRK